MKVILVVLMVLNLSVLAAPLTSKESTKALCETIMQDVTDNKIVEGLHKISEYSGITKAEFEVQMIKCQ